MGTSVQKITFDSNFSINNFSNSNKSNLENKFNSIKSFQMNSNKNNIQEINYDTKTTMKDENTYGKVSSGAGFTITTSSSKSKTLSDNTKTTSGIEIVRTTMVKKSDQDLANTSAIVTGETSSIIKFDDNGLPPDYSKQVDSKYADLEKQIDDKIKEINNQISEVDVQNSFISAINIAISGYNPDSAKKKELEAKKKELETQKEQIEQLKKAEINALNEQFYNNYQNSSDFDKITKNSFSSEELVLIDKVLKNTAFLQYQSYKEYEKQIFEDENGYNILKTMYNTHLQNEYTNNGIEIPEDAKISESEWETVKKILNEGFTYYDLSDLPDDDSLIYGYRSDNILGISLGKFVDYYDYMNDSEVKTVKYLSRKYGNSAAEKYISLKSAELNSRKGMVEAIKFLNDVNVDDPSVGDFIKTTFKGLSDGNDNFWDGINTVLSGLDLDKELSAEQYEAMYIMSGLSDEDIESLDCISDEAKKSLKGLKENNFLSSTYEISSGIGNMFPSIVVSTIISLIGTPAAGQIAGTTLMGISVGGNSAENAYQQGNGYWESIFYGTLSGCSEAALQYFLGGIPGLSKFSELKGFKGFISNVLQEGSEESIQSILDVYLRRIALGEDAEIDWEDVKKSGIYGMITAGIMNGGTIIIRKGTSKIKVKVDTLLELDTVEEMKIKLKELIGMDIDLDSVTQKKQNEVIEKLIEKHPDKKSKIESLSFEELKQSVYSKEIYQITKDNFIDSVIKSKVDNEIWDAKKTELIDNYDDEHFEDSFYELSNDEQKDYIDKNIDSIKLSDYKVNKCTKRGQNHGKKVAYKTIKKIETLKNKGYIKSEYSSDDVLRMIESDVDQSVYLTDEYVKSWRYKWNSYKIDGVEYADLFCFQDSAKSANNLIKYNGDIGAKDGMFVMPKSEYEALIKNPKIFDSNGKCINKKLLGKKLGGVNFDGDVIAIKQTVKMSDLNMSKGSLSTAYYGEFSPGGETQGGITEGVIPQNNYKSDNVEIISHGDITVDNIKNKIENRIKINSKKEE